MYPGKLTNGGMNASNVPEAHRAVNRFFHTTRYPVFGALMTTLTPCRDGAELVTAERGQWGTSRSVPATGCSC
jgi:hypothetical protein